MPSWRSIITECWVGLVLSSWAAEMYGTRETCTNMQLSGPRSRRTSRAASRKGWDSDVADGATDFGDDHIHVIGSLGAHTRLDFVGDVRDNLHALAEVFAGALLAQHFLIDLTGGDVGFWLRKTSRKRS